MEVKGEKEKGGEKWDGFENQQRSLFCIKTNKVY